MTPSRGQVSLRPAPDPDAPAHEHRFEVDVDGVVPHGHVVLVRRRHDHDDTVDEVAVTDLRLDDVALAAEVCVLVEEVAVASGASRLAVPLTPGDLVRAAFVLGGGFRVATARMRLDLDHRLPAEDRVELRPVTAAESEVAVAWEQAVDQHLLVGHEAGDPEAVVGTVWLGLSGPAGSTVVVHDLQVPPTRREQGLGSALLRAVAWWGHGHGAREVALELPAEDHVARGLVDHAGFHLVEEVCLKDLGTDPDAGV